LNRPDSSGRFFFSMTFEITILGCGAAAPTGKHHPSSQVVNLHDKLFLVDCGEGTQMQLRKFKVRMQRINHVFISHLHGDHYLGLMGFISSMHLLGRKTTLHLYGPEALKEIIEMQLKASQTFMEYELVFHVTTKDQKELIYEDKSLLIYSFPMKHRIECCGFLFVEKLRAPKILKEQINKYNLQPLHIIDLKRGKSITLPDGTALSPDDVCLPPDQPKSYAYCSDTAYAEKVIAAIQGVHTLYHESTFLETERERAKTTFHSTAQQAAQVAVASGAKRLILGHFSSRYTDDGQFIDEAKRIFSNVSLADEGRVISIEN
jgi:ribonuclease Z